MTFKLHIEKKEKNHFLYFQSFFLVFLIFLVKPHLVDIFLDFFSIVALLSDLFCSRNKRNANNTYLNIMFNPGGSQLNQSSIMSDLGNLGRAGSVPTLPTRTRLPASISLHTRSAVLTRPGQSRNPRKRLKPFLSQGFRRSQSVIRDVTGDDSLYGGHSALEGGTASETKRDDSVLRELALLRKKYKSLKLDYKHMRTAKDELEFTNRSQARILQQQQTRMIKQNQRDMRVTRVLASMPKEDFMKYEPDYPDQHPSVLERRSQLLPQSLGGGGSGLFDAKPKKVDERSLASNDKMYRNAMGALARDKESLRQKNTTLKRKNSKIKNCCIYIIRI